MVQHGAERVGSTGDTPTFVDWVGFVMLVLLASLSSLQWFISTLQPDYQALDGAVNPLRLNDTDVNELLVRRYTGSETSPTQNGSREATVMDDAAASPATEDDAVESPGMQDDAVASPVMQDTAASPVMDDAAAAPAMDDAAAAPAMDNVAPAPVMDDAAAAPVMDDWASMTGDLVLNRGELEIFDRVVEEQCTVCLEEMPGIDKVETLPCSHKFHSECIKKWFRESETCPVCRESAA